MDDNHVDIIRQMFRIRDEVYDSSTNNIMNYLKSVVEGINKFFLMDFGTSKPEHAKLSWQEIGFVVLNEKQPLENTMLLFVGIIETPIGEEVIMPNGETVIVTEQTFDYFKKMVRAVIPQKMYSATSEDIYDYLHKKKIAEEISAKIQAEQAEKAKVNPLADFDWEALTLAQKKAFVFTEDMLKRKN